jgi:hypothetical protein
MNKMKYKRDKGMEERKESALHLWVFMLWQQYDKRNF